VFGHETLLIDIKYGKPTKILPRINLILTNDRFLFHEDHNLSITVRHKIVEIEGIVEWTNISKKEFFVLVDICFADLLLEIEIPKLEGFIYYGVIEEFKRPSFSWER